MKRSMNRLLSILLALLMVLQIMPISAMAEAETESIADEIVEILEEEALEEQAVPDDTAVDSEESENEFPANDSEDTQTETDVPMKKLNPGQKMAAILVGSISVKKC